MRRAQIWMLAVLLTTSLVMPVVTTVTFESSGNVYALEASLTQIWSDDFNDGNTDGWDIMGFNSTHDLPGNITADDNTLRAYGDGVLHYASHPSTQANGTWSFDVDCAQTLTDHFYVAFVSGISDQLSDGLPYEYGIMIVTGEWGMWNTSFQLYKRYAGQDEIANICRYDPFDVSGWYHIDITRDLFGNFAVYFNGSLEMRGHDYEYTRSDRFAFYTLAGPAIDNVAVYNTIEIDQIDPIWFAEPQDQEINQSEALSYQLNAYDASGISWWVNDTTNFAISQDGLLTNNTVLDFEHYGLNVTVTDGFGNSLSEAFHIHNILVPITTTTTPTTTEPAPQDLTLILLVGGGALAVVIVIVIVRIKTRIIIVDS